jgi:hypothetical protein
MAVIAILAGIILSVNGLVQSKAARAKADAEIRTIATGLEKYKADFGSYPQSPETQTSPSSYTGATNRLDPRLHGDPNSSFYKDASLVLYRALSGDMNLDLAVTDTDANTNIDGSTATTANPVKPTVYLPDFFTPGRLGMTSSGKVAFLKDPYGNSYGYSTKGAAVFQKYQTDVAKDASTSMPTGTNAGGYNTTFDLWSTGGKSTLNTANIGTTKDDTNIWVKNW